MEKLTTLFDSNEIYIADMCRYQQAWLTYLQNDVKTVKNQIQLIQNDTIFKEMAHVFNAEIVFGASEFSKNSRLRRANSFGTRFLMFKKYTRTSMIQKPARRGS